MTFCNFNEVVMETILYVHVCKLCIHNLLFLLPLKDVTSIIHLSITAACHRYFRHRSRVGQQITIQSIGSFRIEMWNLVAYQKPSKMSSGGSHDDMI